MPTPEFITYFVFVVLIPVFLCVSAGTLIELDDKPSAVMMIIGSVVILIISAAWSVA